MTEANPNPPNNTNTSHYAPPGPVGDRGVSQSNRADLVFLFGCLSLFLCWPLGIAAWIMGNADLKRIRAGTLAPAKIGLLKVGRALGIAGTVIFVVSILIGGFVVQRGLRLTDWGVKGLDQILKPSPLPPEHMAFTGEWLGRNGTVIRIGPDGTGDYKDRGTTVEGGRVSIEGDSLSIGILGLSKTWHIDKRPHADDGQWTMQLDGEVFVRRAEGLLVKLPSRARFICSAISGNDSRRSHWTRLRRTILDEREERGLSASSSRSCFFPCPGFPDKLST